MLSTTRKPCNAPPTTKKKAVNRLVTTTPSLMNSSLIFLVLYPRFALIGVKFYCHADIDGFPEFAKRSVLTLASLVISLACWVLSKKSGVFFRSNTIVPSLMLGFLGAPIVAASSVVCKDSNSVQMVAWASMISLFGVGIATTVFLSKYRTALSNLPMNPLWMKVSRFSVRQFPLRSYE